MKRYIIRRLLEIIPTTVGVVVLTFMLFHVVGGSPAEVVLGKNATAEALAAFDARYGYDKPLLVGRWSVVRGGGRADAESSEVLKFLSSGVEQEPGGIPQKREDAKAGDRGQGTEDKGRVWVLAYGLGEGVYRVNAEQVVVRLEREEGSGKAVGEFSGSNVQHSEGRSQRGRAVFEVARGWRAVSMEVWGGLPEVIRVEQCNRGLWDTQFFHYWRSLLRGDLGESSELHQPVAQVLAQGVGPSLTLTVPILVGGTLLGVALGLLCAAWRGGVVDRVVLTLSTVLMSVNYVIWVLAGQYLLAFKWRLFPIWGYESFGYLALPALIGIVSGLGRDVRFYRAAILDEIYKPYVRTAQAKGLSGVRIMLRHVLRNSLIPIVTYVSLSVPFLFTGSLMLEGFFGIPGLGSVSLNAVHSSDMAVVRAVVILGALLYQAVNLMTDLCYAWLDPRVRLG